MPFALPAPFSCALVVVTDVGAPVVTLGFAVGVVNDRTAPNELPMEFWATAQK